MRDGVCAFSFRTLSNFKLYLGKLREGGVVRERIGWGHPPCGAKASLETTSPVASTLADDCRSQWSRRASFSAGVFWTGDLVAEDSVAKTRCEIRNRMANDCAGK